MPRGSLLSQFNLLWLIRCPRDKMYKKRIDDWQLRKNCTASEKEEILRCVEMNRELGVDLGEPIVNGRTVKMHIIERHRKEKRRTRSPGPIVGNGRSTKRACLQRDRFSALISFLGSRILRTIGTVKTYFSK